MTPTEPIHPQDDTIQLASLFAVLRRQVRTLIATAMAVFAIAALFLIATTPRYTATALLQIDPDGGDLLHDTRNTRAGSASAEHAYVDSEVEILRSDAVALALIETEALADHPAFRSEAGVLSKLVGFVGSANAQSGRMPQSSQAHILDRFRDVVDVRRRGLTYLVEVSASLPNPEQAAALANQFAETYIAHQVQTRIDATRIGQETLRRQIRVARDRLDEGQERFDAFIAENAAGLADDPAGVELAAGLRAAHEDRFVLREQMTLAENLSRSKDWATLANLFDDPDLRRLANQRAELSDKLESGAATGTPLLQLENRIAARVRENLSDLGARTRRAEQATARIGNQVLQSLPIEQLPHDVVTELFSIQQEAETARKQYETLLVRLGDLETRAALQIAAGRLVSPAIAPPNAQFPNTTLTLLLSAAIAAGLGVCLSFAREYLFGGVTATGQLAELTGAPEPVAIPFSDDTNEERLGPADRIIDQPLAGYAESVRKLRAAVESGLRTAAKGKQGPSTGQVIMVTSALPAEGKSTSALSLARTYAVSGRKTLLIDADLRKPSLHTQLGLDTGFGFLDFLRAPDKTTPDTKFYARDPASPLAVILGSGRSMMATDQLLTSRAFVDLIEQARSIYDVTIIDTSPLLPVVDARYVAGLADAVILVVKWGETRAGVLRSALTILRRSMREDAVLAPTLNQCGEREIAEEYGAYYQPYPAAT